MSHSSRPVSFFVRQYRDTAAILLVTSSFFHHHACYYLYRNMKKKISKWSGRSAQFSDLVCLVHIFVYTAIVIMWICVVQRKLFCEIELGTYLGIRMIHYYFHPNWIVTVKCTPKYVKCTPKYVKCTPKYVKCNYVKMYS